METPLPKLRSIEAFPIDHGRRSVARYARLAFPA
jgi:hypothetical protein